MQNLKNILVGFLVSFVGSIPLGYLNLIGFEIYSKKGLQSTIEYLFGVVIIEAIVIYLTLIFADFLTKQKKWLTRIEVFTIVFLLILSGSFFFQNPDANQTTNSIYTLYFPVVTGLILSSLNFIQTPFWIGWNLYLVNNKYIVTENKTKYFYVFGTLFGTFFGMLSLIFGLYYFSKNNAVVSQQTISKAIPVLFFALAIFQMFKFYKNHK